MQKQMLMVHVKAQDFMSLFHCLLMAAGSPGRGEASKEENVCGRSSINIYFSVH